MAFSDFFDDLKARDLIAQITFESELKEHIGSGPKTAYIGFDPTADSLHVGHLMQVLTLVRWQRAGHRAIAVAGGATALIGDPTGKSDLRSMLTPDMIDKNIQKISKQLSKFIDFGDSRRGVLVNNLSWLGSKNYLEILRELGTHFTVNRMLAAECFKQRWEKGLTFLEFNYMILQSYDFLALYREFGCTFQMGGDDQWSNILSGMELIRRMDRGQAFCLTTKLLTTSDGKKMGKTEKGAVWLDPNLTSPYEFYQYWRNVEDQAVALCLRAFTFLDMKETNRLIALQGSEINEAKKVLAYEMTALIHGKEEAEKASQAAASLFGNAAGGDENIPQKDVSLEKLSGSQLVVDLLVVSELFTSKGEARRMIEQGGVTVDDQKVAGALATFDLVRAKSEGLLLRKGKKVYLKVFIK